MSIDARVTEVIRNHDGTATMKLGDRDSRHSCGQSSMTIVNPPAGDLSGIVGTEIWGGGQSLMVGDKKFANRIGYTRCELVPKKAD